MNLVLLLPAALAALAAAAVPLLLHVARRQQQRPTVFAALRWLHANPKPRRRIRFDEWPLLLVRLLLVVLLSLLLARPALLGVEDARPRLLVAVDVPAAAAAAAAADGDVDARWLAPGFPALEQGPPPAPAAAASLLREFDATLPEQAPLAVLVTDRFRGADAARLRLSREVDWRIAAARVAAPDEAGAPPRSAPAIAILHDSASRDAARYLRAAAASWQDAEAPDITVVEADGPLPAGTTVLAWLRAGPVPPAVLQWVERGGQVLLAVDAQWPGHAAGAAAWRDAAGEPLLEVSPRGRGRFLRFTRVLEPRAMPQLLDGDFPRRLRDALLAPAAPTLVAAADYLPATGARATPPPPRELRPWLALAIALLALLERWLATSRRRGASG